MELKSRQERLVFVDPEDESISYWWPALVVPEEEFELFKETMDNDAGVNVGDHERLVCYFEDGSFSVVPRSALIPFDPQHEPFLAYSRSIRSFTMDAGVRRAVQFYNHGRIPALFKWLTLAETGYMEDGAESDASHRVAEERDAAELEQMAPKTVVNRKLTKLQLKMNKGDKSQRQSANQQPIPSQDARTNKAKRQENTKRARLGKVKRGRQMVEVVELETPLVDSLQPLQPLQPLQVESQ